MKQVMPSKWSAYTVWFMIRLCLDMRYVFIKVGTIQQWLSALRLEVFRPIKIRLMMPYKLKRDNFMTSELMEKYSVFNEIQAKGENEGGKFLYSNSLEKVAKSSFLLHCLSICCWTNFSWIGTFRSVFIFLIRALRNLESRPPGVLPFYVLSVSNGPLFEIMKPKKSFYRCLQWRVKL